jgi:hypothetical protein
MSTRGALLLIDGVTYEASLWPSQMPNPGRNKFLVYRNGQFVATAKTKKEFEEKCRDGWYDACADAVEADASSTLDEMATTSQHIALGIGGGK